MKPGIFRWNGMPKSDTCLSFEIDEISDMAPPHTRNATSAEARSAPLRHDVASAEPVMFAYILDQPA